MSDLQISEKLCAGKANVCLTWSNDMKMLSLYNVLIFNTPFLNHWMNALSKREAGNKWLAMTGAKIDMDTSP